MCLPHIDSDFSGQDGIVAGWGWIVFSNDTIGTIDPATRHMFKVSVPILEHDSPRCKRSRYLLLLFLF